MYQYSPQRNGKGNSTGWNLVSDPNYPYPESYFNRPSDPQFSVRASEPFKKLQRENAPLPGGAVRMPPDAAGRMPAGGDYHFLPSEDPSLGIIAVPKTTALETQNIVKYRADGTPVEMKVPSYWDPSKITQENPYAPAGNAPSPVFDRPPPGMPVVAPTGKADITVGMDTELGPDRRDPATWRPPTIGTGGAPPAGADSYEARAARQFPNAGQAQQRRDAVEAMRAADAVRDNKIQVEQAKGQIRKDIETQKETGRTMRADQRNEIRLKNLDFLRDKATQDFEARTFNAASREIMTTVRTKFANGEPLSTAEQYHYENLITEAKARGMPVPHVYDGTVALPAGPRAAPAAAPAAGAPTTLKLGPNGEPPAGHRIVTLPDGRKVLTPVQ